MMDERVSDHAHLRFLQRTGEREKPLSDVWESSVPCDVKHHGYDEARVSPEYDVVMLQADGRIVTVLYSGPLDVSVGPDHLEEYLESSLSDVD